MAFVVILFKGEELTRRELTGPIVIGRAPECDVSVRDILLSRRHCRIAPEEGGGWVVEDLGSKNGTRIGGEPVTRATLRDAMGIRLGNTRVKFYAGAFRRGSNDLNANNGAARKRPSDPFEALSGTVSAFEYKPRRPARDLSKLPTPCPKPTDPASYSDEDVYSLLTELASSSWDSIYATASGPAAVAVDGQRKRQLPNAGATVGKAAPDTAPAPAADLPRRSRYVPPDPSLQAVPDPPAAGTVAPEARAEPPSTAAAAAPLAPPPVVSKPAASSHPARGWLNPMGVLLRSLRGALTGNFARRAS